MSKNLASWTFVVMIGGIALGGPGIAWADEIQVNTYTTDDQEGPAVAVGPDGAVVVVWISESASGTDASDTSIQGQRYAPNGSALGGEFQVNTYTTSFQEKPSIAIASDGGFVVVWFSNGSTGADLLGTSIQGQRFASDGSTLGSQFQVNVYPTSDQLRPDIAMDAAGDFVVTWSSYGSSGTDSSLPIPVRGKEEIGSVQGRRFASDGSALSSEFQVNTYTTGAQYYSAVAAHGAGHFIITWTSDGSAGTDTSEESVQGQRYASDGSALGGEFQVNTYTTSTQKNSSVAMSAEGDFVVVWVSFGSAGTDTWSGSVQARRFASDGSAVGVQFQVNAYTTNYQSVPAVGVDADGDFVAVWRSKGSAGTDTSSSSIQARRFSSDGSTVGDDLQINTYTTAGQSFPRVAVSPEGEFVVVWESYGSGGTDSSLFSIQKTPAWLLFSDGFESGNTSAWSNSL